MITHPRRTDQQRVLSLVERNPGLPATLLMWLAAGGEVRTGEGAVETVTLDFARLVKVLSVEKRLADLVRQGAVKRGVAVIQTRHSDTGYYAAVAPVGRERQSRNETAVDGPGRRQAVGKGYLERLRGVLGS